MTHTKRTLVLIGLTLLNVACQPAPKQDTRRFGRTAFGSPTLGPQSASTQVTYVTNPGGDMVMSYEASRLAAPAVADQPQWALGFVSGTSGVKIWSESYVVRQSLSDGASGAIDPNRSRLHIEVADNRTGQSDSDGNVLAPFVLHIGYDQSGFEGASGGIVNGAVDITYNQAGYGYVAIRGTVTGDTFAGQVFFSNTQVDGEHVLGQFTMSACGFFVCQ